MDWKSFLIWTQVVTCVIGYPFPDVTWMTLERIKNATIRIVIEERDNPTLDGDSHEYMVPIFVRLAFHDCVGQNGCDGCLNLNNPSNDGLAHPLDLLKPVYNEEFASSVTVADFLALVGTFAVERALENNWRLRPGVREDDVSLPSLKYFWGREDHVECDGDWYYNLDNSFPDPKWTGKRIRKWFKDDFSFGWKEGVALMGAHGLGKARVSGSGYRGMWVQHGEGNQKDVLDNKFYVDLIDESGMLDWEQIILSGPNKLREWQYGHPARKAANEKGLMLPADMCMWLDCTGNIDPTTGHINETVHGTGGQSVAATHVQSFADDQDHFFDEFTKVWHKMVSRGECTTSDYSSTSLGVLTPDGSGDIPNTCN